MRPADVIYSAIYHEEQEVVPIECRGFAGFLSEDEEAAVPSSADFDESRRFKEHLSLMKKTGSHIVGAPVGFGGIGMEKAISYGDHTVYRTDFGSLIYIRNYPDYVRRIISQAVRWPEDLDHIEVPEPDPTRYSEAFRFINFFKEQGYFIVAGMKGPFDASWYFIRNFNPWLADLVRAIRGSSKYKDFARRIIALAVEPQIENLKMIVEGGLDMVNVSEDLGTWQQPFISPRIYREFIYPWHKKIVDIFHKKGCFVQLHSHGQINPLLPYMVDAGFDVLNPLEPEDNIDLAEVKEKYGDRIAISAVTTWRTAFMSLEEAKEHIIDRVRLGALGGGFFLNTGYLPGRGYRIYDRTIRREDFETFLTMVNRIRKSYAKYPLCKN